MVHVLIMTAARYFSSRDVCGSNLQKLGCSIGPIWSGVMLERHLHQRSDHGLDEQDEAARDFHYKMGSSTTASEPSCRKRSIFSGVEKEDLKKVLPSRVVFIVDKRAVG